MVADSPDGVLAFDRECRYTLWNAAMEHLSGIRATDAIGRVAFELFPFLVETGEDRCFREVLAGRPASSFDRPFVIPETGRSGFFEARYAPLYGPDGDVIGGVGIIRDVAGIVRQVTRQVRAERDAAAAHARAERALKLQALVLERMGEGVTVANEYGTIVYTNPTTDRMFGYGPGELAGRHITVLTTHPGSENALIAAEVVDRLRADGYWHGEWRNVKKDGAVFVTETRITTLDVEGRPHWFCVQQDITEQRRGAARKTFLEEATRLLNESLDYHHTLQALTRHCLPFLADYCSVDVLTDDGEIRRVETAHVDAAKEQILRDLWTRYPYRATDRVGVPEVLRTRTPVLNAAFPEEAVAAFARDGAHLEMLRRLAPRSYICVPLVARGRAYGAISLVMSDSGRRYTERDLELAIELAQRAATAIDNSRLYTAEHVARARAAFMSDASAMLASSLDYEATLRGVARSVVPELADWCSVQIVDEDDAGNRALRQLAVAHVDPRKVEWARRLYDRYPSRLDDPQGVATVIRTGKPELYPHVTAQMLRLQARDEEHLELLREIGLTSVIIAPLASRGRTLGAITFVATESGRRYTADDLALAVELARRAATAVDNARLFREAQAARTVAEDARAAAEDANRAKSEFLAVMSHELRTPLNAIGGYAELIELGIRGPVTPEQREALQRIQVSQKHLLGLINEVLNYARVESGAIGYDLANVPVAEVARAAEALVAPQIRSKGLVLQPSESHPDDLTARADREKVQQILLNLLSNAVKFTEPGGRIQVRCAPADGRVQIQVRDTGIGIPAEKLDSIFEPFVQIGRALNRPTEGTGLGLAISRDLARGMGGDLTAESTLGEGSVITLTLPKA
ncbi:MAG: ATP-binding protein [Gemmatimonadota bacterium]|nr:ATP-binding protein [Gemmatimonadota bacterium]